MWCGTLPGTASKEQVSSRTLTIQDEKMWCERLPRTTSIGQVSSGKFTNSGRKDVVREATPHHIDRTGRQRNT